MNKSKYHRFKKNTDLYKSKIVKKSIIFSAPSGSGKTTVVKHLLKVMGDQLAFSVSATTRKPREGETNGLEYHFLEPSVFKQHVQENAFLEYEEVYAGILYGTLWSEVHKIWDLNKAVIFDVDVKGGLNLKRQFGDQALAVFLRPPSVEILMERLTKRSTEVEHQLKERIAKANYELSFENQYDIVVVNDDLSTTLRECEQIVQDFLNR
jgi:guanylate kinase